MRSPPCGHSCRLGRRSRRRHAHLLEAATAVASNSMLTPGQKAARTKRERYGAEGLREIAAKAYRTRKQRQDERLTALERHLARSAGAAVSRAKRRGWEFEEDLAGWALAIMKAQGHRCYLSGVPFSLDRLGRGAAPRPYAPSIDRIDASGGYTADNIRVICWAANLLLGTWGDGPALEVAEGMARRRGVR